MAIRNLRSAVALCCLAAALCAAPSLRAEGRTAGEQELRDAPLDDLLRRDDVRALDELRRRFDETAEKLEKQRIASVLVRHLDNDAPYWEFLEGHARQAVESEMPFPYAFDAEGKIVSRQYAPAFLLWANRAQISPDVAARYALTTAPLDVFLLALTNDSRGRNLLWQGLEAPNFVVVYRAAWGLARLRDVAAVPHIIAAADALPAQSGEMVARALLLFVDSPAAQAAADRLIPDATTRAALRGRALQELQMNIGEARP